MIADAGLVGSIDLLGIGIDGNDYYVWKAINVVEPRAVVIEYNAKFPPNHVWKMAYNAQHQYDGSDWFGASLKALELLGRELGYQLVGTDPNGVSAFFVRHDLAANRFAEPATAESLYHPARQPRPSNVYLGDQSPNIGHANYNAQQFNAMLVNRTGNGLPQDMKEKARAKIAALNLPANSMVYHPTKTHSNFFLPLANDDTIQQLILLYDDYFEGGLLRRIAFDFKSGLISKRIGEKGSVVVDIGANIGNHTVYFANELHAGKVIAFEPVPQTFQILSVNVQINKLQDRVELRNAGLSNKNDRASIAVYNPGNVGGTSLTQGKGQLALTTLDALNLQSIAFIKMDVEGMEVEALEGALETIKRTRPPMLIESFNDRFPLVEEFFGKLDYRYESLPDSNYLFYPAELDNYHDPELENYDIVITTHASHVAQLSHGLPLINEYLGHDKIIMLSSAAAYEPFKAAGIGWLDENAVLNDMNLSSIRELIAKRGGIPGRAGWYFQQFLKMYYAFVCEKEYYLIWDADTIPLKPLYFRNRFGQMFFNMKTEHHLPYFETMSRLFKEPMKFVEGSNPSFISEGMIIKTSVMRELVEELGGKDFWRNILNAIDQKDINGSGFSEFETYGTWLFNKYPQLYKSRPLETQRHGASTFGRILNDEELRRLPYDTISFENWDF